MARRSVAVAVLVAAMTHSCASQAARRFAHGMPGAAGLARTKRAGGAGGVACMRWRRAREREVVEAWVSLSRGPEPTWEAGSLAMPTEPAPGRCEIACYEAIMLDVRHFWPVWRAWTGRSTIRAAMRRDGATWRRRGRVMMAPKQRAPRRGVT